MGGGVSEPEYISHGEVESPMQSTDQQAKNNHLFSSLGRQSSIYSLTLDEFQHTLCEGGKNFGSMNMDEFLTSIWTAEENQAINSSTQTNNNNAMGNNNNNISNNSHYPHLANNEMRVEKKGGIAKQPSLPRQGSLTLPPPLYQKTVDEVWSEIHRGQQAQSQQKPNNVQNSEFAPRQPTFGEMTLEDFLVKAGVVREPDSLLAGAPPPQPPQQQQQYGMFQNSNPAVGPSFVNRPVMGLGAGAGGASTSNAAATAIPNYQTMPPQSGVTCGESSGYATNGKRNGAYPAAPPQTVRFGGGGGYGAAQPIGMAAPVSPVSSDGMGGSQVENNGGQFGLDMGGGELRGRKRILNGPVEKVVERRQRRMIKNRESAARSRARKQAYTVELEAELNQLREENAHLKQALAELERKRKQQYFEEMKVKAQTKAQKAKEKLQVMMRSHSGPL